MRVCCRAGHHGGRLDWSWPSVLQHSLTCRCTGALAGQCWLSLTCPSPAPHKVHRHLTSTTSLWNLGHMVPLMHSSVASTAL